MGSITINGKTYVGGNVLIKDNKVFIDGKDQTPDDKIITITVQGDINDLSADIVKEIHVQGSVGNLAGLINGSVKTISGDIKHRK